MVYVHENGYLEKEIAHLKATNQFVWTEILSKGLTPLWIDDVRHFINSFLLTVGSELMKMNTKIY